MESKAPNGAAITDPFAYIDAEFGDPCPSESEIRRFPLLSVLSCTSSFSPSSHFRPADAPILSSSSSLPDSPDAAAAAADATTTAVVADVATTTTVVADVATTALAADATTVTDIADASTTADSAALDLELPPSPNPASPDEIPTERPPKRFKECIGEDSKPTSSVPGEEVDEKHDERD
ncbi:hypothetical protein J5N97_020679 [Dioscorea zingiberensis]|uniref:Uncharacterized protein n=1 Tax=Dioscorea zingiberensis TaxID=325984 RepID=A0A9D5HDW6_9LILI|nr:hypothetical protein J5N97_020679 [Dioscorea zingiberensis]